MFGFLKDKRFYINLLIIGILGIVIIWGTVLSLNSFTRHGVEISVPDFSDMIYSELIEDPAYENFDFIIVDSVFDQSREYNAVVSQNPKPESKVKPGRSIYLTVVASQPEQVKVPELKDLSLRNATSLLQTYGLKVGKLSYVPDFAKNAVIQQKYKGEEIEPGQKVVKGAGIELVLGLGDQHELLPVPLLIGKTHSEAARIIHSSSLNLGPEHFEPGDDTSSVRVYRQSPNFTDKSVARYGAEVELWYKSDANFDFDEYLKKLKPVNVDTIYGLPDSTTAL
jgi:beta-lactam-binding protein with PASTA domain